MGKKTDKLYLTHTEHSGEHGQHTAGGVGAKRRDVILSKLPFDCCALTLKPFETPVATTEGTIYELLAIIPFLKQHGTDPMTGKKLTPGELVRLNFHKNADGQYHDPVTFKIFNDHTAIAAIKTSGNVYARESIDRLNVKPGNWNDLMTDEPFSRKDIITLQDPLNVQAKDLSKFDYVKRNLEVQNEEDSLSGINVEASGIGRVLKSIAEKEKKENDAKAAPKSLPPPVASTSTSTSTSAPVSTSSLISQSTGPVPYNTATVSTNRTAASFTSTSSALSTAVENALWDEEDLMYEAVREKGERGYARMKTNYGDLNLELYAERAPRTCYNFLKLAQEGKYQKIKFHRLIPGFMLQGGDPTGTGRGGESIWGKPFEDEYNVRNALKHDHRGTLSMANSGPNTNGSQFFLTFREQCPHLDGKHTVFGRLVGGQDVLSKLERVPIDPATDRPLKPVMLEDVQVFGDPFEEYKQRLSRRLQREEEERLGRNEKERLKEERKKDRTTWFGTDLAAPVQSALETAAAPSSAQGVGKYLSNPSAAAKTPIAASSTKRKEPTSAAETSDLFAQLGGGNDGGGGGGQKKKKRMGGGFGDFAGW
ncbi:PPIL2 family peptidylprolyl isomerase [Sporobolomyces salmoneus]|uniref:PPIL2 family peptidylprolyl isomerase n=1 Tax=Sporobolomyces salmoneus TaxID=183962 RepID=UPI00316B889F